MRTWLILAVLGCLTAPGNVALAVVPGRIGSAAGALQTSPAAVSRVFMGRGMVVPPRPADFLAMNPDFDTDVDGQPDVWDADNDNDGITDLEELVLGTEPNLADSDADGMPDLWELQHGLDPVAAADADEDKDGDGRTGLQEYLDATDPEEYLLALEAGWNLIAVARLPDDPTVTGIFGGKVAGTVWCWVNGHYAAATELQPSRGYWVFAPAASNVLIPTPAGQDSDGDGYSDAEEVAMGTNPGEYALRLDLGWNLVSLARQPTDNRASAIFGSHTVGPAWAQRDGHLQPLSRLKPLQGFWVYSPAAQVLVVPP